MPRRYDQTIAEDYFAAMQRVEQGLKIVPEPKQYTEDGVVKVQEPAKVLQLIGRLELPELCLEERLGIACQLREALGKLNEHAPPNESIMLTRRKELLIDYQSRNLFATCHQTPKSAVPEITSKMRESISLKIRSP
jgi:hypothetical protein